MFYGDSLLASCSGPKTQGAELPIVRRLRQYIQ
jgi:hypothetical protein